MSRSCMCFGLGKRGNSDEDKDSKKKDTSGGSRLNTESSNQPSAQQNKAIAFTYEQLVAATDDFNNTNLLGEGGIGAVYKGKLEDTGQFIAVKRPVRGRLHGNKDFLREIIMLPHVRHPNLVQMIGYCDESNQRLLVYEYMPLGSLADHLHGLKPDRKILDWSTRMKIAAGAAKGLQHLHDGVTPPVIHKEIKSANILLGEEFHPKLSDFGLSKLSVSRPIKGIPGYYAPEYISTGRPTKQSDIFSFGVVLLELVTGRPAKSSSGSERTLVDWVRHRMQNIDNVHISQLVDPMLQGQVSESMLRKVLTMSYACITEDVSARPPISEVVFILDDLVAHPHVPNRAEASSSESKNKESTLDDAINREK